MKSINFFEHVYRPKILKLKKQNNFFQIIYIFSFSLTSCYKAFNRNILVSQLYCFPNNVTGKKKFYSLFFTRSLQVSLPSFLGFSTDLEICPNGLSFAADSVEEIRSPGSSFEHFRRSSGSLRTRSGPPTFFPAN